MVYKNKLLPWCIIRLVPNGREAELSQKESRLIIRLRHRSDAEAHLQILRANNPTASYEILFDVTPEQFSTASQEALPHHAIKV
jgi:hypothetical protein